MKKIPFDPHDQLPIIGTLHEDGTLTGPIFDKIVVEGKYTFWGDRAYIGPGHSHDYKLLPIPKLPPEFKRDSRIRATFECIEPERGEDDEKDD